MLAPSLCASKQKKTKWFNGWKEHRTTLQKGRIKHLGVFHRSNAMERWCQSFSNAQLWKSSGVTSSETRLLFTFNAMLPAKESRSSRSIPMRIEFQGSRYCSRSTASDEKPYITLVRLCSGVRCCSNLDCAAAGPFRGGETFRTLRTKLDLTCHRASVTGERYVPGHRVGVFSFGVGVTRDDKDSIDANLLKKSS